MNIQKNWEWGIKGRKIDTKVKNEGERGDQSKRKGEMHVLTSREKKTRVKKQQNPLINKKKGNFNPSGTQALLSYPLLELELER
jgi:hypothetical protein